MKRIITAALMIMFAVNMAQAQNMNLDLGKLDPEIAAKVLENQQRINAREKKAEIPKEPPVTVSQAKEWADVGQNLAGAVGATAKALSIEVNDFVKTPVGWWAFAFIFWYFLGAKLWHIIGGCIIWAILGGVIWHSFRIFHIPTRRLKSQEGNVKTFEYEKYAFESKDARTWSAIVHAGAFVLLTLVMLLIVF